MEPVLNEQSRRRWAATEAKALGRGGVSCVVRVTGLARRTVYRGLDDIRRRHEAGLGRIRTAAEVASQRSFTTPRF